MPVMDAGHGCRPWMPVMGAGHGCRSWVQVMGAGHGCRLWVQVMGAGQGYRRKGTITNSPTACESLGRGRGWCARYLWVPIWLNPIYNHIYQPLAHVREKGTHTPSYMSALIYRSWHIWCP